MKHYIAIFVVAGLLTGQAVASDDLAKAKNLSLIHI